MNWKKALVVAPMSAAILFSANGGLVSAESMEKPTVDNAAVDLRANLGSLLGEHGNLAIITMRKGIEGAKDFDAAAAQLGENTQALSDAIASVYGDEAGKAFNDMWSAHVGYFVDYVNGTAKEDEEAKQAALDELSQYRKDFSAFLDKATEGRVEADSLAEGLQTHVNQLISAFDSYVAGDYATAFSKQADARSHLYMTAKGLSSAITAQFPDKFENQMAVTPAADLRLTLNNILSGHVAFAVTAMQNGIEGEDSAKVFEANAAQLAANTDKLSAAIGSVYGDEAAAKFKEMWSGHIGYFVDYVKATAAEDEAAKQEALDQLKQYRADFSAFMETATDGNAPADVVSEELQDHVNQLIASFDAYAAGDYEKAYDKFHEGYSYANEISKSLSGAIVTQMPDKFAADMPSEMPETGFAPADNNNDMMMLWILGASALALAAIVAIRKYQTSEQK